MRIRLLDLFGGGLIFFLVLGVALRLHPRGLIMHGVVGAGVLEGVPSCCLSRPLHVPPVRGFVPGRFKGLLRFARDREGVHSWQPSLRYGTAG